MTQNPTIYLTRWLDEDAWESMLENPKDLVDYESNLAPQVYGVHSTEALATEFGKNGLLAELREIFDYEDNDEDDQEALERIDAATWIEGEWTAMQYHPGCEERILRLVDEDEEILGAVAIQRRRLDGEQ